MSPVRLLIVLVAAVSAIGMAVVLQRALGVKADKPLAAAAPAAAPAKPMTQVLVAKHDLAIGARLTQADIDWLAWPSDSLNAAFITNGAAPAQGESTSGAVALAKAAVTGQMIGGDPAKALDGAIVRDPILAGEPITARKIVRGGEGGYLSVVLTPGKRAVAVPVSADTTAGGFILPGDRVDVISTRDTPLPGGVGGRVIVGETVMRNIRVLALDQKTVADKDAKSQIATTATLEVGAAEAEALAAAKAGGPGTLALRAYTDAGAPSGGVAGPSDPAAVRINRGGQTSSVVVRP
jgi:pilus assembly protein CpaB